MVCRSIVAERRNFTPLKARQLADGSIFTGSQGLENGLIDAIGDEETAKEWLVTEKRIVGRSENRKSGNRSEIADSAAS